MIQQDKPGLFRSWAESVIKIMLAIVSGAVVFALAIWAWGKWPL